MGNIHKSTETLFSRREEQENRAKTQREVVLDIFRTHDSRWFTRETLQRVYKERTGKKLKDTSASRTLSNLTAVPCKHCGNLFSQAETRRELCSDCQTVLVYYGGTPIEPPLIKSDAPVTMGNDGVMVHAWRFNHKWREIK